MADRRHLEFDLQEFLRDMRTEQQRAHDQLVTRVQEGFNAIEHRAKILSDELQDHNINDVVIAGEMNRRLGVLEQVSRTARWVGGTIIIAAVGFIFRTGAELVRWIVLHT